MAVAEVLDRGVAQVIVRDELEGMLRSDRPLRIKYGVDPSRPDLHLGHVVCFRKLRQLQELGHKVVVIVGDWTARIGDPSGRSETRPMLTEEQVRQNAQTYLDQFFKVVDVEKAEIVWQSAWFDEFTLADVIKLTSKYTVAQMLARDDFSLRHSQGNPITIAEFLYPLLQAYDSVAIEADVELGGTDQTFNLLVGREMQRQFGQGPQQIITMQLLVGTDGVQKMSKSLGNYIAVNEPPAQVYGKVMSLPDEQIESYFWLLTDIPEEELQRLSAGMKEGKVNPRDVKMRLARDIVTSLYDEKAASAAEEQFIRIFQRRELPDHIPEVSIKRPYKIIELLVELGTAASRSEARRLVEQGGIRQDGETIWDINHEINPSGYTGGTVIQRGRRHFWRIVGPDEKPKEET